jgi:hypothetical protein
VVAVCADLEPYKEAVRPGQTGYLFRDVAELETVLERALAEGEVRAGIVARAARYATGQRLERSHARDRLGFYLSSAAQLGAKPNGPNMGRVTARRGHQVLLPKGAAYQLTSSKPAVVIVQTMDGPETVKRWSEICTLA